MELDYFEYVVAFYHKKIEENDLSGRLVGASPAMLRDLCLETCKRRFSRKDQQILVDFFGAASDQAEMLAEIKRIDIDKFKPLIRYIRRETNRTSLVNIELLAWLLDIPDRPYNRNIDYEKKKEELSARSDAPLNPVVEETQVLDRNGEETSGHPSGDRRQMPGLSAITGEDNKAASPSPSAIIEQVSIRRQLVKVAILFFSVLAIGLIGLKLYNMAQKPQSCMYWTGEEYEAISCNQKMADAVLIAYDSVKVENFKKIINIDTITYNSIGHIWYSKMNNIVEFYTAEGRHPVQMHYRLRPVTTHIIDVYVKNR